MRHISSAGGLVWSRRAVAFPVQLMGCRPHAARITLLWLSLLTATAAAETAPTCWMASDLAYHKGDERVHKTVTRIAPPRRILAEYSPIAQRGAVRRVKLAGDKKLVALTFDLCEQPSEISGYQGGIVDFLREHRIKATFFMGGKWILSHRERAQQLMPIRCSKWQTTLGN